MILGNSGILFNISDASLNTSFILLIGSLWLFNQFSKIGLDFNSPDSQLCHIILLSLSSKNEPDKHRKFITLFRSMVADSNIRTLMLEAANSTQISKIINDWEDQYSLMDDLE